jgi:mycothiol synthase
VEIDADLQWRPLGRDAGRAWWTAIAAVQTADDDKDFIGADELAEEFDNPELDFERGSIAAFDGSTMAGFALFTRHQEAGTGYMTRLWSRVHPEYRGLGIGSRLLEWAERAAVPLHKEKSGDKPLSLVTSNFSTVTDALALLEACGYQHVRWFHSMTCDLTTRLPQACVPDGFEIVGYSSERQADALLVKNDSFRDHWGSAPTSEEAWAYQVGYHAFRPAFSFLAYRGTEPVGVLIAQEYDAYREATGSRELYIANLGVRKAARRRGLASALMVAAMRAARQDGCAQAGLGVDADSPTGALGVYERLGFVIRDTSISMIKPISLS